MALSDASNGYVTCREVWLRFSDECLICTCIIAAVYIRLLAVNDGGTYRCHKAKG